MVVAAGLILLLPGCGHSNSGGLSAAESQAFDKGPPEVKQMWTLALEASKTNDYVTAYNMLYNLGSQSLSPDQKQAVTKQTASLNDRMLDGVGKGDPAAQNALEELKRNPPNRQPH
jgi:hypothetical protein